MCSPICYPLHQVPSILDGSKFKTARKPDLRGITLGSCKFMNNFRFGAFAKANICNIEEIHISSFDDKLARELGSSNLDEYLTNNWNSDYDSRKVIEWDALDIYWDVVKKLGL